MKAPAGLSAVSMLIITLLGCASEPLVERLADPPGGSSWRIAVLPAEPAPFEAGKESPVFTIETLEEMRECLTLQLPRESFHVISLPRVDEVAPPGAPVPQDPDAIIRLARKLDARVIILPELFSWDRDYYLVHSVARVGLRVSLFDGETGALLFRSSHESVRNEGLLKIPTGYGAVLYGPIRGILHFRMTYLCDRVSSEVALDLGTFAHSARIDATPDETDREPPVVEIPPIAPSEMTSGAARKRPIDPLEPPQGNAFFLR